ncbi:hypothetical protein Sango_2740600 [Sesamum angolense]|uniref:Reverse transcriptase zinc-binding domain-containing protein n=1 Tax=Sesamum angolense TaxID=2727404 RepID=A0AAE1T7Y2_9LAMI|nr:hypothetical protein Sango_2740600 [Sesamum angolense]
MCCEFNLPRWSWFTDYNGPGNRIWIAWDDELLDMDVLNLDVQFIHCRITIHSAHLSVLATVVYGASDSIGRRGLWQNLVMLAQSIYDEPWIVGGNFNMVLDMSECRENVFLGIIAVRANVAYGNDWIDCLSMMLGSNVWRYRIEGTAMYAVIRKLLALKSVFRTLRRNKGDLSLNVKLAAEFLGTVQNLLQIDRHNALLICLEQCCKLVFFKATKLEQIMLQQRAKIQWLKGGDQCSRIFFRKRTKRQARMATPRIFKAAWPIIGEELNEGFSFHWRCKELGLFQLCFANDLLLFCKADVASVNVFKRGLDEFVKLSELHTNPQKSQLILSRSAQAIREQLIAALQFQEGHLLLRLRHKSVWTVDEKGGSWGWRKLIRLRYALLPQIEFKIGDGESFSPWHDPWHSLGPLITRFSRGPGLTNTSLSAKLSMVIAEGEWRWLPITDMECMEIIHLLPIIHNGNDFIQWRGANFTTKIAYDIFRLPGPKVGGECVLCHREMETHEYLFFQCSFSRQCLREMKDIVRFSWPNRAWGLDITWASRRWTGRHVVQAAYRALLVSIVYNIWQERNRRILQHIERPSSNVARMAVDEIR